ncbi:acyl carrier protein [Desulfomicrobium escambiense]|uniref:acyl carrier protein n=1 Tax=Desulfomicrobium escambiense TaxID=29503 RepID=UPI0004152311|nr:phosphopantetheine-binding protein [Desulfomicrobium escambiense]
MSNIETITAAINGILADILDLDPELITPETYVVRDLRAESIDLLEIGVAIQHRLDMEVDDDTLFLKNMRKVLARAAKAGTAPEAALADEYPHLDSARIAEIVTDRETGPVIKVRDLIAYAADRAGDRED